MRELRYKEIISVAFLLFSDIISIFLSLLTAYFFRASILPHIFSAFKMKPVPLENFLSAFYLLGIWLLLFFHDRLYTRRLLFWEETRLIFKNTTLSIIIVMLLTFILRKERAFSRAVFILLWIFTLFLIPFFRLITKKTLFKLGYWNRNVVIAGAGSTGLRVAKEIEATPYLGYKVAGFLDDDKDKIGSKINGIEVLGKLSEIEKWMKKTSSEDVIIAIPTIKEDKLKSFVEKCEPIAKNINFVSRFGLFSLYNLRTEHINSFLLISMKGRLLSSWLVTIKDTYERLAVAIISPFLAILTCIISILIKLDSPGPVFFRQERLGKDGKKFKLLKFRTMYKNSDEILKRFLSENPEMREEWEKFRKIRGKDPRVTHLGKFLRKWSIDEIPQLFHVLKGEMSLVGPRPYIPGELENNSSFKIITKVKPGVTGLWQISGRNLLTFEDRIKLDEFYIRNWSLWQDFVIILKTIKTILKGEGAF